MLLFPLTDEEASSERLTHLLTLTQLVSSQQDLNPDESDRGVTFLFFAPRHLLFCALDPWHSAFALGRASAGVPEGRLVPLWAEQQGVNA